MRLPAEQIASAILYSLAFNNLAVPKGKLDVFRNI